MTARPRRRADWAVTNGRFAATVSWRRRRKTAAGTRVRVFAIRVGPKNKARSPDDLIPGDGGRVELALSDLDQPVIKVVFPVVVEGPEESSPVTFGRLRGAVITFSAEPSGIRIATYDLSEEFDRDRAVVAGEIVRADENWRFRAMGHAWDGGLDAIRRDYGIK